MDKTDIFLILFWILLIIDIVVFHILGVKL